MDSIRKHIDEARVAEAAHTKRQAFVRFCLSEESEPKDPKACALAFQRYDAALVAGVFDFPVPGYQLSDTLWQCGVLEGEVRFSDEDPEIFLGAVVTISFSKDNYVASFYEEAQWIEHDRGEDMNYSEARSYQDNFEENTCNDLEESFEMWMDSVAHWFEVSLSRFKHSEATWRLSPGNAWNLHSFEDVVQMAESAWGGKFNRWEFDPFVRPNDPCAVGMCASGLMVVLHRDKVDHHCAVPLVSCASAAEAASLLGQVCRAASLANGNTGFRYQGPDFNVRCTDSLVGVAATLCEVRAGVPVSASFARAARRLAPHDLLGIEM